MLDSELLIKSSWMFIDTDHISRDIVCPKIDPYNADLTIKPGFEFIC